MLFGGIKRGLIGIIRINLSYLFHERFVINFFKSLTYLRVI